MCHALLGDNEELDMTRKPSTRMNEAKLCAWNVYQQQQH